jgi:hypothetical protein
MAIELFEINFTTRESRQPFERLIASHVILMIELIQNIGKLWKKLKIKYKTHNIGNISEYYSKFIIKKFFNSYFIDFRGPLPKGTFTYIMPRGQFYFLL